MLRITNYFPSIYAYLAMNTYIMAWVIKILMNMTRDQSFKESPLMENALCWRREEMPELIPTEGLFHILSHHFFPSNRILLR